MAVSAELWLKVKDEASRKIDALKGKVAGLGASMKTHLGDTMTRVGQGLFRVLDRLGAYLLRLGKYAALVGVGLAGWALGKGVGFAAQLEQWNEQLSVLYKSSLRAREAMAFLRKFAETTPFEMSEVVPSALALETGGLSIERWMRVAGDLAAAVKRPFEEVAGGLARVASGVEVQETLRRFLIPRQALQLKGVQFGGGGELLSSTNELMNAVEKIVQERFGGMTERASKTFLGRWSTLKDNFMGILANLATGVQQSLGKSIEWVIGLTERLSKSGAIERWGKAIGDAFSKAAQWVAKLAENFEATAKTKGFGAALGQLWEDFSPKLVEVLSKAFKLALTAAWEGIKGLWSSSPIGKVLLALYAGRGLGALGTDLGAPGLGKGIGKLGLVAGTAYAGYELGNALGQWGQGEQFRMTRMNEREEDLGSMSAYWGRRGEAMLGPAGGLAAQVEFLKAAERYKDLREASLKTEELLTGQYQKQVEHVTALVEKTRAKLHAIEQARDASLAEVEAVRGYADEQIKAAERKALEPKQKLLEIEKELAALRERSMGIAFRTGEPGSIQQGTREALEYAKRYVALRLEAYEIQVKENQKAHEFNESLKERLYGMSSGKRYLSQMALGQLQRVGSVGELERLLGSQRFMERIPGGIETVKRFQPQLWAQLPAGPQMAVQAGPSLADVPPVYKAMLDQIAESVTQAGQVQRDELVAGLTAALQQSAVGLVIKGKLDTVLQVKADETSVREAIAQILSELPAAIVQEWRRQMLPAALAQRGEELSEDAAVQPASGY